MIFERICVFVNILKIFQACKIFESIVSLKLYVTCALSILHINVKFQKNQIQFDEFLKYIKKSQII